MKYKAELQDLYLSLKDDNKSITAIANAVFNDDNNIDLSLDTLKVYLRTIKREASVVTTIDNEEDWNVVRDKYIFSHKGDKKVFSIAMIDNIFLYYTNRGYNFTRSQVQQRFNLTPRTFKIVQQKFNLSKESDIFSPHTKSTSSIEELSAMTEKVMEEVVNSGELTTRKHAQALNRKYNTVIQKENLDGVWKKEVISEFLEEYPNCETIEFTRIKETNSQYKEISVNIADLHSGSKSERMKITENWSMEVMEQKLESAAILINSYNSPVVHLNFLGDLVETVSGVNHPDSWKLVQDGMFGAKTIIHAKNVLVRFISRINNVRTINGVGGNHDRLQASNKMADTGATDLIFAMIKERVELSGSDVEVNYDPTLLSLDRGDYGDILCHGDKGLHKRSLEFLILQFAKDKNKFQFINTGHLHTLMIRNNDSQHIGRRTVCPSIITGNNYSDEQLGKSDRSGMMINAINAVGHPDQIIHNF